MKGNRPAGQRRRHNDLAVIPGSTAGLSLTALLIATLVTISAAMASFSARADSGTQSLQEHDWNHTIPKVIFATRQQQPITSAPSSVTIITREMIQAQGAFHLADILRLVPGFQVFLSNGSTFGVTPHGFSDRDPRRLEVRVNGRSAYLPQLASVAWESLGVLPEDVDYIEVVRGSNVPAYGSNAILGAVNIVTRNPVVAAGSRIDITSGDAQTRIASFSHSVKLTGSELLLRGAYKESHGFDGVDDAAHMGHLVASGVFTPNLSHSLEFEMGLSQGDFGVGDGDHLDEFTNDDRHAFWANGRWKYFSSDDQHWNLGLSWADYRYENSRPVLLSSLLQVPPAWIPLLVPGHEDEALELETGRRDFAVFNAELEHHLEWQSGHQLVWGLGARGDLLHTDHFVRGDGKVDTWVYYLFANVNKPLNRRWEMNGGFMLEKKNGFDAELSPRLAFNYHYRPGQHLRISATRAYRQPALMESDRLWTIRFANGDLVDLVHSSDPDIGSEQVDTLEIGYLGFWGQGRWSLDIKLFQERVRDAIDGIDTNENTCSVPLTGIEALLRRYCQSFFVDGHYGAPFDKRQRVFTNSGNWETEGLEAELSYKLDDSRSLRLTYAYLESEGSRIKSLEDGLSFGDYEDAVPRHSASLLLTQALGNHWRFNGFAHYVDQVAWRSGTDVDSYTRLDLNLGRTWRWANNEAELTLTLQNVADADYLEFQRNNHFGRRAFISFSLAWP